MQRATRAVGNLKATFTISKLDSVTSQAGRALSRNSHMSHSGIQTLSRTDMRGAGARSLSSMRAKESPFRSLSKVTLIGRTGSVPEVRTFEDGNESLLLSVATNHSVKGENASDPWDVETQWHKVSISGAMPGFEFLSTLPIGSQLFVEGGLRIRTVDDEGSVRQYVNVNVNPGEGTVRVLNSPWQKRVLHEDSSSELPF